MKRILSLAPAAGLPLVLLCACSPNMSLNTSGDYDPFVAPGMSRGALDHAAARGVKGGTIVHAIVGNAAFFKKRPDGSANADKLLPIGTEMKAISDDLSYMKVELNNGEVGYIPSVQVSDQKAANLIPATPAYSPGPGAVQVYPPMPSAPKTITSPEQPYLPPAADPESSSPAVPPTSPEKPPGE